MLELVEPIRQLEHGLLDNNPVNQLVSRSSSLTNQDVRLGRLGPKPFQILLLVCQEVLMLSFLELKILLSFENLMDLVVKATHVSWLDAISYGHQPM